MAKERKTGAFHAFEHTGWSDKSVVDNYQAAFGRLTTQVIPTLLDAANVANGVRVLDIASGPGYAAFAAAERGAEVVAIDFSPAMVALAKESHPQIDFREGDAQALDLPDASFDAVVINFGILHCEKPELALREAGRVLRSGGRLGFTVWANPQKAAAFGMVLEAVQAFGDVAAPSLPAGPSIFRFSDDAECWRTLEGAGFIQAEVVEVSQAWRLPSVEALVTALEEGTVRNRGLLRAQTDERLTQIRLFIAEAAVRYRLVDGSVEIPMPAVLASAVKP
jgi:ubiquinone/menaquinone biosynthesis C-methylase UbiE